MKDMIIKGTGNSRYLKSVSNFLSLYPTYESFVSALVAGTLPIDLNGTNSAGITQAGTPLTQANLLDSSAAQFAGLTNSDPTVNQALTNALRFPRTNISTNISLGLEHIRHYLNATADCTITIPTRSSVSFPLGAEFKISANGHDVRIMPSSGVTLGNNGTYGDSSQGFRVASSGSIMTLKYLTSDIWVLSGPSYNEWSTSLVLAGKNVDYEPTENSQNLVTSGGVYQAFLESGYSQWTYHGGSFSLGVSDLHKFITCGDTAAMTVTVPKRGTVFPQYCEFAISNSIGNTVTIVPANGVTIDSLGGKRNVSYNGVVHLKNTFDDEWVLYGDLE